MSKWMNQRWNSQVETPALAIDLHMTSVEDSGTARAYGSLKDAEPRGRSIFTIKRSEKIKHLM